MKVVIFDFDGVIVDSEREKFAVVQRVAARHRLMVRDGSFLSFIGRKRGYFLKEMFPTVPPELMVTMMKQIHKEDAGLSFSLLPGVVEVLQFLKEKQVSVALATGSERVVVERVLKKHDILDFFSTIVTGDEVTASKPDPAVFFSVFELFPDAEEVVIVEDSPAGVEAAAKTSAIVICLGDSRNAEVHVKDHKELLSWFEQKWG